MNGFINLNKPSGMTSHDAVNHVRRIFSTRKVGHAGTLDPAACGVLPIALGRATKFIEYLADLDKTYRAEILFGTSTTSGDLEGATIAHVDNVLMPTRDALQDALSCFVGEVEQTPPRFSAIKINGRKAYDLARRDIAFDMPRRLVKIFRLELVSVEANVVTVEVTCGKGTYIRSLAIDIGERLSLPATLKSLVRLRVGGFTLEDALTLNEKIGADYLLPIEKCLSHLPRFELAEDRERAFLNGLPTSTREPDSKALRIFAGGTFLGVGRIERGELRSSKIV